MATNATVCVPLSGSIQFKPIKVVATATVGTVIHTTPNSLYTAGFDRLYLFAMNTDTVVRTLTLEWGGVTAPDQNKVVAIPSQQGDVLIVDGLPLSGDGSGGLTVGAFCSAANVVMISGYVLRVTP